MDEQKIVESDLIIDHRTYCFNPKGECHWSCGKDCEWHYKQPMIKIIGSLLDTYWDERCDKEEAIRVILSLIAEDREKHNTLRWHTAKKHFDDGVETQEDRDILSGLIDTLDCAECMKQAKLAFIEREAGLVEALKEAKCPNCDGSGEIPHQISEHHVVSHDMAIDAGNPSLEGSLYSYDEFELEQCQWCDERNKLIGGR